MTSSCGASSSIPVRASWALCSISLWVRGTDSGTTSPGTNFGPDWDFDMNVPATRDTGAVLQDYRDAIEDSDAAIRASGDPNAFAVRPVAGGSSPI